MAIIKVVYTYQDNIINEKCLNELRKKMKIYPSQELINQICFEEAKSLKANQKLCIYVSENEIRITRVD